MKYIAILFIALLFMTTAFRIREEFEKTGVIDGEAEAARVQYNPVTANPLDLDAPWLQVTGGKTPHQHCVDRCMASRYKSAGAVIESVASLGITGISAAIACSNSCASNVNGYQ